MKQSIKSRLSIFGLLTLILAPSIGLKANTAFAGSFSLSNIVPIDIPTPSVSILAPLPLATVFGATEVIWETTGDHVEYVDIVYAVDGQRYYAAHNIKNSGQYTWYVPNSLKGKQISLSVELTDLATSMASTSEPLSVAGAVDYTQIIPDLSAHLVKASTGTAVFYLGTDGLLYPFTSEAQFKSWNLKFSDVRVMPTNQLDQHALGSFMAPPPGKTLVKAVGDNNVYVVELNKANPARPYLHKLVSEAAAISYFGSDWSNMITPVAPSIITMSLHGNDFLDPVVAPRFSY